MFVRESKKMFRSIVRMCVRFIVSSIRCSFVSNLPFVTLFSFIQVFSASSILITHSIGI